MTLAMMRYLRVLEVMSPQWSDFILTAYIPHCEADVLVFDRFHIETCRTKTHKFIHKIGKLRKNIKCHDILD